MHCKKNYKNSSISLYKHDFISEMSIFNSLDIMVSGFQIKGSSKKVNIDDYKKGGKKR